MNEAWNAASSQVVPLTEVDGVEIISLMDNSVDFLSTNEREEVQNVTEWIKEHKGEQWVRKHFRRPLAEHGFSMLIRVFRDGKYAYVLFDTGASRDGVVTNAARMGLNFNEIECIVLSHGHHDHFGGLLPALKVINKDNLPIIVHEDMFKTRGVANPDGTVRKLSKFPAENQVVPARYIKTRQPYFIAENMILVTGEIPRQTDFEKGFPQHRVFDGGKWRPDPWILDDRAVVINVRRKGLVVLSGCAHAGIINTILYAQQIVGVNDVHALMGGFHLAGKESEQRISQTVEKLKLLNPKLLAPSHCTGWRGICAIAEAFSHNFVWNSVGNRYRL